MPAHRARVGQGLRPPSRRCCLSIHGATIVPGSRCPPPCVPDGAAGHAERRGRHSGADDNVSGRTSRIMHSGIHKGLSPMSFMAPRPFAAQPIYHEAHTLDAATATARPNSGGRALDGVRDPRRRAPTPRPVAATIGGRRSWPGVRPRSRCHGIISALRWTVWAAWAVSPRPIVTHWSTRTPASSTHTPFVVPARRRGDLIGLLPRIVLEPALRPARAVAGNKKGGGDK